MPYNRQNIPESPIPVSMLPRATTLTENDLLYLVQPGNTPGQHSRSVELDALFDSPFAGPAYAAGAAPKFYEFTYDGPIPRTGVAPNQPGDDSVGTRIAYLEVPFKHQAIFWIDGYSDTATTSGSTTEYTYALRLTARSLWGPNDDYNHDLFFPCFTGIRHIVGGEIGLDPKIQFPGSSGSPGLLYIPYTARGQWWLHNPAHDVGPVPNAPMKSLSLFAFGGGSNNQYQAQDPSSYHLNIHVLVFPDHKYDFPAG